MRQELLLARAGKNGHNDLETRIGNTGTRGVIISLIVGVHGIAKQQLGRRSMLEAWQAALGDGMERAGMAREMPNPDLDIAFYGDVFLPERDETKGTVSLGDDWLLAGIDEAEETELAEQAVLDFPAAFEGKNGKDKAFTQTPKPLQHVIRALDSYFWPSAGILFVGELRQVRRYLRDPGLKAKVHQRVHAAVTAGARTRVLIGHSLGSVVAVEYLRSHPDVKVDLLLTCGSPLGARLVRSKMRDAGTLPANATLWTDVRDPRDPVAFSGELSAFWPGVIDREVDNQGDAHSVERYLRKRRTGEAVIKVVNAPDDAA